MSAQSKRRVVQLSLDLQPGKSGEATGSLRYTDSHAHFALRTPTSQLLALTCGSTSSARLAIPLAAHRTLWLVGAARRGRSLLLHVQAPRYRRTVSLTGRILLRCTAPKPSRHAAPAKKHTSTKLHSH